MVPCVAKGTTKILEGSRIDVVRDYERIQLQGRFHVVLVRKSKRNGLYAQIRRKDEVYIHNDVRTWAMWDHYPICARIQDEEQTKNSAKGKRKKKWTGWKPKTDEQTIEFRKRVMEKYDVKSDEDWLLYRRLSRLSW